MRNYEIKNVTQVFELTPLPEQNQKSFYGKAKVYVTPDYQYLTSYDEVICRKSSEGRVERIWLGSTPTTRKHIKAFTGLLKRDYDLCPEVEL